jgi:hypothetical protein
MAVPHVLNRPAHQRHHSLPCATSHRALVIAARGLSASRRPLDASATTAAPALALKEAGRHQGLQDGRNRTAWVRSRGSFVFFVKIGQIRPIVGQIFILASPLMVGLIWPNLT